MLTETLISVLRNDATLRGLLGTGLTQNTAPIQADTVVNTTTGLNVVVHVVLGESEEVGPTHGVVMIEVFCPEGTTTPVSKVVSVLSRINTLLNLKGSQLTDSSTTVYRLRRLHTDPNVDYDATSKCHIGIIEFEFFIA